MIDVDQNLRLEIWRAFPRGGKERGINKRSGAFFERVGNMRASFLGGVHTNHWPQRSVGIERIAQLVFSGQFHETFDELMVNVVMNVDSLDGAARLTGVEHCAIN